MLFNSYVFLLFGLLVFCFYFLVNNWNVRKVFLMLISYVFYAAWNAPYLLLIIFSTILDFFSAKGMARSKKSWHKKMFLAASLMGNLGVLTYFKYGGFLLENFVALAATVGIDYRPMPWSVLLPVGISFYTFQTLSYTIDVYRGKMKPTKSFLDFALFVTFFPQLVAGPIVRACDFIPQLIKPPKVTLEQFGWGLALALFGLFQKVAIADGIAAPIVDEIYKQQGILPFTTVVMSMIAFTIQVLCDFSGYSLIAIGIACCLGFHLQENFRGPYASLGYQDLWGRWHVSMSGWFRDYLYGPIRSLGKKSLFTTIGAQATTLVLIGLWHGASWTFVLWGAYNAVVVCSEMVLKKSIGHWRFWKQRFLFPLYAILTYSIFAFSAILFRATDMVQAREMYASFYRTPENAYHVSSLDTALIFVCIVTIFLVHYYIRERSFEGVAKAIPVPVRTVMLSGMILSIALMGKTNDSFIYFQF